MRESGIYLDDLANTWQFVSFVVVEICAAHIFDVGLLGIVETLVDRLPERGIEIIDKVFENGTLIFFLLGHF
jgi:hypothetical protein